MLRLVDKYVGVGGQGVSVFKVPNALRLYVLCKDRIKGPAEATAIVTPGETEIIPSDKILDALGIILIKPGEGLWRFDDDPPNTLRRSELPKYGRLVLGLKNFS